MREWQYWTRNKLEILAGYLPAFNQASVRSPERVYIDLMVGQSYNRDKTTGEQFDGSARLALRHSQPLHGSPSVSWNPTRPLSVRSTGTLPWA
jgi:three-Cys-motif partner protein